MIRVNTMKCTDVSSEKGERKSYRNEFDKFSSHGPGSNRRPDLCEDYGSSYNFGYVAAEYGNLCTAILIRPGT